jgi:hypothetical protein
MIQNITDEELDFYLLLHDPAFLGEALFNNFDNFNEYDENEFGTIRDYQLPMLSYDLMYSDDPNLDDKENFELKKKAADINNFASRKLGKSLVCLLIDMFESFIMRCGWDTVFTSGDFAHIKKPMDKFTTAVELHKILKVFKQKVNRNPYDIVAKNGFHIQSINQNLSSKKDVGVQFFGLHYKMHWHEEASRETDEVFNIRVDAVSEWGAIERNSGMTDFPKHSPAGRMWDDKDSQGTIVNMPQYVRQTWGEKEENEAVKKYGSKSSPGYRIYVLGELVEGTASALDMKKVRECYDDNKEIQTFSIDKNNLEQYKDLIIVERPKNCDRLFIASDIGESAGTDIIIVSEFANKCKYLYNITLYDLTDIQQKEIFKWLIIQLKAEVTGLDVSDGTGRAIYNYLINEFKKENIVRVAFNEKLKVDFLKDEKGKPILNNEYKPTYVEEYVLDWSINQIRHLFYNKLISCPMDYKLDIQFSKVVTFKGSNRVLYQCLAQEDHLWQAFQVFSIARWIKQFEILTAANKPAPSLGCSGTL